MLTFFPIIQEDELFFGLLARYHERSLNKSEKKTKNELGLSNLNPLITNNIQNIIGKLELFETPNKEHFLKEHTLFNYFSNFLSVYEQEKLNQYMVDGFKEGNNNYIKKLYLDRYKLKYCPNCVREDIEKRGESIWKLSHQLPTAYFCLKHNVLLEEWNISHNDPILKTVRISDLSGIKKRPFSHRTSFYAKRITEQSLNLNKECINLEINYKFGDGKFYLLLFENGYVKKNGKVNIIKLKEDMTTFYGNEFLNLVKFKQSTYENIENNPLKCNINFNFTETLLFINFFFESVMDFIKYKYKLPSRETGPFSCLNYFCKSFNQKIINHFRTYMDDSKKYLKIEIKCHRCNCYYNMVFRIWDGYLIEVIVDKSIEWKMKVMDLISNKGWSIEKVSNKLQINSIEIEGILFENKINILTDYLAPIRAIDGEIEWIKKDREVLLYLKKL